MSKITPLGGHSMPQDNCLIHHDMLKQNTLHVPSLRPAPLRVRTPCDEESGTAKTSRLLALPAELRELIWIHTVTEWRPTRDSKQASSSPRRMQMLEKRPIRIDRLNRPLPPAITRASRQVQAETLPLYYQNNIFECWRPLFWLYDSSVSTVVDWTTSLQPDKIKWLRNIVLLYKSKDELEHDAVQHLLEQGLELNNCAITSKLELSEYEQCFEGLGLPRHFGRKRRFDRYGAAHVNAS